MTYFHPRQDEHGNQVTIKHPSKASLPSTWHNPTAVATFLPDGETPLSINGIELAPWRDHPKTTEGWNFVDGVDDKLEEPPFHVPAGKKAASGVVIREPDGRVWLVAPTNKFGGYETTWPKGRIEPGLSSQATAIREAWEESGLCVRITGFLGDFTRSTTQTRLYLAERIGGTPAEAGWEAQAITLAPLTALDQLLNAATDKPVLATLRKFFAAELSSDVNAEGGNLVRVLQALDGFFASHGAWPTSLLMSEGCLATLVTHHLSPQGFFKLQSKLQIQTEIESELIAKDTTGKQFNYTQVGWDVQNDEALARSWLGFEPT